MPVATAAEIKTALSSHLKVAESDMASYWTAITTRAALFAAQEVYGRLLARGFRMTEDILRWDRLSEVTLDLGCWKSIMSGGVYAGFDPEALKSLDRREELASVYVFVNGDLVERVQPATGQPGTVVTGGPMAADPGGVFNFEPAPDDPHSGIHW